MVHPKTKKGNKQINLQKCISALGGRCSCVLCAGLKKERLQQHTHTHVTKTTIRNQQNTLQQSSVARCNFPSSRPRRRPAMAERAALFTWDDRSMNHLFQHRSASTMAPRDGIPFPPRRPPSLSLQPSAETDVFHAKSRASLCWCNGTAEPFFKTRTLRPLFVLFCTSGRACSFK